MVRSLRVLWWWGLLLAVVASGCGELAAPPDSTDPVTGAESATTTAGVENEIDFDAFRAALDQSDSPPRLLPEVTPGDVEVIAGNEGFTYFMYSFDPVDYGDGATVTLDMSFTRSPEGTAAEAAWVFEGGVSADSSRDFYVTIPKSVLADASLAEFTPPPDEIVDPDPVLKWVNVDRKTDGIYAVFNVASLPQNASPEEAVQAISTIIDDMRVPLQVDACIAKNMPDVGRFFSEAHAAQCVLNVLMSNPDAFTPEACPSVVESRGELDPIWVWDGFAAACRALSDVARDGLSDEGCGATDSKTTLACKIFVQATIDDFCSGQPRWARYAEFDRYMCLSDMAHAVGVKRVCDMIDDQDLAVDCRARVAGDWTMCSVVSDPTTREVCCESTAAGDDEYRACMEGVDSENPGGGAVSSTTTAPTTTAAPTTTTTAEPPPIGGDVVSIDNPGFFAEYHCTIESSPAENAVVPSVEWTARYTRSDGHFMVEDSESGEPPVPLRPPGIHEAMFAHMFSPGPWLPLDGSTYVLVEAWSADTNKSPTTSDIETYSDLTFVPGGAGTLTQGGWDWNVVTYTGGYTYDEDDVSRENTDNWETKVSRKTSFTAWYHGRTGLLLGSDVVEERTAFSTTDEHAQDRPLGVTVTGGCELVDTSLDLSG